MSLPAKDHPARDPRDEKIDLLERSLKELRRQNRDLRAKCGNQRNQIAAKDAALTRLYGQSANNTIREAV